MSLRQLFPVCAADPDLAALYAYPDGLWLRANMVSSADGAASANGLTAGLSSATDRRVFSLLRTLSDVVVAGAATVRAEKYELAKTRELWRDLRAGRPPTPTIAVVSAQLDLDLSSPLFAAAPPHARTIVITTTGAPADRRAALASQAAPPPEPGCSTARARLLHRLPPGRSATRTTPHIHHAAYSCECDVLTNRASASLVT